MANLRVVPPTPEEPIATDKEAIDLVQLHWIGARDAYSLILGGVGSHYLRRMITGKGTVTQWQLTQMAKEARAIAAHATTVAEHLEHAESVFDRRNT